MVITRKLILCFLMTLALFAAGTMIAEEAFAAAANWFDEDWFYRKQITINSSQVPGDLTNFSVLINRIDPDWRDTANGGKVVQSDGGDILFTDSSGNKLSHEIEKYDPSTGELIVWVNVPSISSSPPDTFIYIYYGNTIDLSDQWETDGSTWDSNYRGVWHLKEEQTGTGNPALYQDSTANNNDGDDNISATGQSGQIDSGQEFDGGDDYIDVGSVGISGNSARTISLWVKPNSISGIDAVFGAGARSIDRSFTIELNRNETNNVFFEGWGHDIYTGANAVTVGEWNYIVITYDGVSTGSTGIGGMGSGLDILVNGVEIPWISYTAGGDTALNTADSSYGFGARTSGASQDLFFNGFIDEVRISNTNRSADWIETSYNNLNNPSSFLTVSEQVTIPTMTEWGMIVFAVLAGLGAVYSLRRKKVEG